jgi:hypothetical protein
MSDTTTHVPDEGTLLGDGLRVIGTPEARATLFGELAKATAAFKRVSKERDVSFPTRRKDGSRGPDVEYSYATYASHRNAIDDALGEHGIVCIAAPHGMTNNFVTTCLAGHGAELWSTIKIQPVQGMDVKQLGALFTYYRRYQLAAMLGLEGERDADEMPAEQLRPEPAPKPQARSPKPKPEPAPKSDEPQWTTDQQQAIIGHSTRLGFTGNQEGFRALLEEFLGHPIARGARKQPLITKAEAGLVIERLSTWSPTGSEDDFPSQADYSGTNTELEDAR